MNIKDLNGQPIEVTDLDLAIMQADNYRHYRRSAEEFAEADKRLQNYWQHLYEVLVELRKSLPPTDNKRTADGQD